MLNYYVMFSVVMFFTGTLVFCMKCKHLLLMLLSLEFIMLSLYLMLYFYFYTFAGEYYFSLIFLTMAVCEGALGLSLLVSFVRSFGNDYFQSFNILW